MKKRFSFTLAIAMVLFASNAYALFGIGGKVLMPEDTEDPRFMSELDTALYNEMAISIQKALNDGVPRGSNEFNIYLVAAVDAAMKNAGYSMDKTFHYVISQRDMYFWQRTFLYAGYGNLLQILFMSMNDQVARSTLVENGLISEKTNTEWDAYRKWAKEIEGGGQ